MKKIKYHYILPALLGLLFVASCSKEPQDDGASTTTGEPVSVPFSFSCSEPTAIDGGVSDLGTRTIPEGANAVTDKIKNIWVIQFDGVLLTSKVIGVPRYIDYTIINSDAQTGVVSLLPTDMAYQVWIANFPHGANYDWGLSPTSTFADVATKILTGDSESQSYATIDGVKTMMMNAVTKSVAEISTPLTPVFSRLAATVSLKVNSLATGLTITSARLCNVPTTIYLADKALTELNLVGSGQIFPYGSPMINYLSTESGTADMTATINSTKTGTYDWYMSRNSQGTSASTSIQDKTFFAPTNATYFEVKVKDATGKSGVFKIYPGKDQINDYNIEPNKTYTSTIDIKGVGDPDVADSRVETYADRDFRGTNSNCYILNPNPGAVRTFTIPVTQVNRYWSAAGEGYGTKSNAIGASEAWTVAVIWSDIDGNAGSYLTTNGGKATGTGPNDFFKIALPANLKSGNFTIKIYKNSAPSTTLWSWHFWVTDYNPDGFSNSSINNAQVNGSGIPNGIFTYTVTGGQVERYTGGVWASGGVYERKIIMDRSIGAVESYFTTQPSNGLRGQIHYQFGRKDPFPTATSLNSTIWGTNISTRPSPADDQVLISAAVTNPVQYYNRNITGGNWASEASRVDYIWNDPVGTVSGSKSIYDPCPAGWRVPVNGTWNSFNSTTTLSPLRDLGWGSGRGIGSGSSQVNGLRYWPGTAASPAGGRVWYPASGNRYSYSGGLNNVGSYGYYWSSSPNSTAYGYSLYFYSGGVNPSSSSNRASGFPVRCVQE